MLLFGDKKKDQVDFAHIRLKQYYADLQVVRLDLESCAREAIAGAPPSEEVLLLRKEKDGILHKIAEIIPNFSNPSELGGLHIDSIIRLYDKHKAMLAITGLDSPDDTNTSADERLSNTPPSPGGLGNKIPK